MFILKKSLNTTRPFRHINPAVINPVPVKAETVVPEQKEPKKPKAKPAKVEAEEPAVAPDNKEQN